MHGFDGFLGVSNDSLRLLRRALKQRWPIPPETRADIERTVFAEIAKIDQAPNNRRKLRLAQVAVEAAEQNTDNLLAAVDQLIERLKRSAE